MAQRGYTLAQMQYEEAQQALRELYSAASIATIKQEITAAQDTEPSAKDWLAYLLSPEVVEAEANLTIAQDKLAKAQFQAITGINLTRQDMMSIMQSQGTMIGDGQGGNTQSGTSTNVGGFRQEETNSRDSGTNRQTQRATQLVQLPLNPTTFQSRC